VSGTYMYPPDVIPSGASLIGEGGGGMLTGLEFMTLLGSVAAMRPLSARNQQPATPNRENTQ
jgi:hypothetical protein